MCLWHAFAIRAVDLADIAIKRGVFPTQREGLSNC